MPEEEEWTEPMPEEEEEEWTEPLPVPEEEWGMTEDTPSSSDDECVSHWENMAQDCKALAEEDGQDVTLLEWCTYDEWGSECDDMYACWASMKWNGEEYYGTCDEMMKVAGWEDSEDDEGSASFEDQEEPADDGEPSDEAVDGDDEDEATPADDEDEWPEDDEAVDGDDEDEATPADEEDEWPEDDEAVDGDDEGEAAEAAAATAADAEA